MIGGVSYDGRNFEAAPTEPELTQAVRHIRRAEELLAGLHGGIYPHGSTVTAQVAQVHATLAVALTQVREG